MSDADQTIQELRRRLHDALNDAAAHGMMLEAVCRRLGCENAVDILRALDEQTGHLAPVTVIWRAGTRADTKSGWRWVVQTLSHLASAYSSAGLYQDAAEINYCALMALHRIEMAPVLSAEEVPA